MSRGRKVCGITFVLKRKFLTCKWHGYFNLKVFDFTFETFVIRKRILAALGKDRT